MKIEKATDIHGGGLIILVLTYRTIVDNVGSRGDSGPLRLSTGYY